MVVALIDADVLVYAAASVGRQTIDWDGTGDDAVYENEARAEESVESVIKSWTKAAKADSHRLVFSDRTHPQATFRYSVHPSYKGQRADEKPPLHDYVYDYLHSQPNVVDRPGLEGDDVLGLMITGPNKDDYVAVTIDKDMGTVPGRWCNPMTPGKNKTVTISQYQADYNWMTQTLTGDTIDNYKGAPGIGKVTAQKLLVDTKNITDMWARVIEGFNKQFDHDRWYKEFVTDTAWDEALLNARCARILRYGDYDPDGHRVRLWHPDEDYEWRNLV